MRGFSKTLKEISRIIIRDVIERFSKKEFKYFHQRLMRGFDDTETFSLDHSLAKIILPRLKRFKELSIARPYDMTESEWNIILDKMIFSFEFAASDRLFADPNDEWAEYQEGLELFGKHYSNLSW